MKQNIMYNGVPWFDQNGNTVNAHGGCVVEDDGVFYLFGEYKTNDINKFNGFSCYSSKDLSTWYFEGMALPPQQSVLLGPDRIGERVKVIKNEKTRQFIMLMHTDDLNYMDPHIGLAVSDTITGPYEFVGPLLYNGEPIRRWDMGTFVELDGTAYLLLHEGDLYRLSKDYLVAEEKMVENIAPGGESPTMFRAGEYYFWMFSNKTSWERNDNYYFVAKNLSGPWKSQGLFCPEGSLTHNSQCSFAFTLNDTPIYMGDRWSFPQQASSATQVWLPVKVEGDRCMIPEYWEAWDVNTCQPVTIEGNESQLVFRSNKQGESVQFSFEGSRILVYGMSDCHSGYANIQILNQGADIVHTSIIDFYSLVPDSTIRYVSPVLPQGKYTLEVEVLGENGVWTDKTKTIFGSDDYYVTIEKVKVIHDEITIENQS